MPQNVVVLVGRVLLSIMFIMSGFGKLMDPSGTAQMKNVHGSFRGLILADFVTHLNGDFVLLGALMSFGDDAIGNAFGNGNAIVRLCTTALNDLPSVGGGTKVKILSWSRSVAQ